MQKSVNNKDFDMSLDALYAKTSSFVREIIAVVGTPKNIDRNK